MMKFSEVNEAIKTGNPFDTSELPIERSCLVVAYNYSRLLERMRGMPVLPSYTK